MSRARAADRSAMLGYYVGTVSVGFAWLRASMGARGRLLDVVAAVESSGALRADCTVDGVHLSELGHVRLADALPLSLPVS